MIYPPSTEPNLRLDSDVAGWSVWLDFGWKAGCFNKAGWLDDFDNIPVAKYIKWNISSEMQTFFRGLQATSMLLTDVSDCLCGRK